MAGRIEFAASPLHRDATDKSMRVAQATTIDKGGLEQPPDELRGPEALFRDLTLARRDIELLQHFEQEHDRAEQLEQALAAARRDVETQTALAAKAGNEVTELKQAATGGTMELQKSLQQERDRTGQLEQALAKISAASSRTALPAAASAHRVLEKVPIRAGT
ncbi:hypothetical protein [Bradyrhizobium sp. Ec3.3]|uniref:hypothetical protein n=1 Tax=Bradyrhizobium sp. Ec3.3 TaxID=189753 RepID=UPI00041F9917|nr:hypothetical protein [Bradyrhizobium sp. Ec3.3]